MKRYKFGTVMYAAIDKDDIDSKASVQVKQ